jgi:hypothetical protein
MTGKRNLDIKIIRLILVCINKHGDIPHYNACRPPNLLITLKTICKANNIVDLLIRIDIPESETGRDHTLVEFVQGCPFSARRQKSKVLGCLV